MVATTEVTAEFDKQVKDKDDTVTINGKEYTIVETYGADKDADQKAGKYTKADAKGLIADGSTVTFANGKTMKAMKGADDGVDDEDNTIITADHAYDLAKKSYLQLTRLE